MFTRRETTPQRSGLADIKPVDRSMDTGVIPPPTIPRSHLAEAPAAPTLPSPMQGTFSGPMPSNSQPSIGSFSTGSIIGNDLTIMGQGLRIVTRGRLQVDGRIEGDVVGNEVIVGANGHVEGVVSGETVVVQGSVSGTVKGISVTLQSSARVEGDVHHQKLAVEQGAHLDGRVRRPADISELKPDLGVSH